MRQADLYRLISRAVQRWHRLRNPEAFILRDKVGGKHADFAVRIDGDDSIEHPGVVVNNHLKLYSAGGKQLGEMRL